MKRMMPVLASLFCIALLAACAGSVPMMAKNRVSIRSVVIDRQVPLPEVMFYRGPEFTLEAFGVEGCMTRPGGSVIWKKYAYVTNIGDQTPSYTIGELVTDPERIRQAFQVSAQIVAADLVHHMQGF